jgi:hypothetical protein
MAVAWGVVIGCVAGQPAASMAAQQADVAAYVAEQLACAAQSSDSLQARVCVAAVRERWCGPGGQLAMAGACGDGGTITQADSAWDAKYGDGQ